MGFGFVVKCSAQVRGFFPTMLYMLKNSGSVEQGGGGGGAGGAIAPQISRWGGLSPPCALPSGSYCERVFVEIAVLSVTVSLNRVT